MRDAFAVEAAQKDISLADPKKAAYLIRGYVTTYAADKGTAVAVVYDVFDAKKKRAQRLEDSVIVARAGADPWPGFDGAAMSALAAKSVDDLAAFLATTPEAVAFAANSARTTARGEARTDQSSKSEISPRLGSQSLGPDSGQTIAPRAEPAGAASASATNGLSMAALR